MKLLLRTFVTVLAACAFVGCAGQQTEKGEVKEEKEEESNTAPISVPTKQDGAAKAATAPPELALGDGMTDPRSGLEIEVAEEVVAYDVPPDAPGTLKGKMNTMPSFDPASERLLAFEVGISNPTDHPLSLHPEAFTLEDANGNRFDRVIHFEVVGGETYRLEEFLPGQSRSIRVGFEAPRNGQDLRLVFRPAGSAVALWIIPSVEEITSGGVPAEAG